MTYTYKTLIFCLVIIFLSKSSFGQFNNRADKCEPLSPCTLLSECPNLLSLLRSGNAANIKGVQRQICGFQGRRSKVCCPIESPVTPPPIAGETLLPKNCGRASVIDRIFGGDPAPIGAYPWMVALGYINRGVRGIKFLCSGSLINERYVLTAAHCLDSELLGARKLTVVNLGDWDISNDGIDCASTVLGPNCAHGKHITAGVESTILHPEYNKRATSSDDIALIRMNITVDFNRQGGIVQPICLPPLNLDPTRVSGNRVPIAAGWGLTENSTTSNILLRVNLPFSGNSICRDAYGDRYIGKQLCVGGIGGKDTCSGDSGAPLMLPGPDGPPFLQIGIVSFGPLPCGIDKKPAVYTSVSSYRTWIVDQLRP